MRKINLGLALYIINKHAKGSMDCDQIAHGKRLYNAKDAVIKKLDIKPIDMHEFPIGDMYLYEIDGFTFHSSYRPDSTPAMEASKKIELIKDRKSVLDLTTEEEVACYQVINEYLGYKAVEY